MQKKTSNADKLIKKLASASINDAVKLLFMSGDDMDKLDGLDLSLLSSVKRTPEGTVELKFVDKLAVLTKFSDISRQQLFESENGVNFYTALDRAAISLRENGDNEV